MASEGDHCPQCWAGSLQLHEGMLVCDACGSVHQGFAEETQEYQTGISDARFFTKSQGMRGVGAAAKEAADVPPPLPPVAEAVRAYVRALQALLYRQAQALVSTCGMHPALLPVLRELWLAFVAHTQLLEPASLTRLQALAEMGGGSASDHGSDGDEGGGAGGGRAAQQGGGGVLAVGGPRGQPPPPQMTHDRLSLRVQNVLGPKLRPQHTLSLLLLACWRQGEAASPLDVARWALDGRLPYLSFVAEEGLALQQYRVVLGRRLITPTGVPTPNLLLTMAQSQGQQMGLACPPLSPALWLERYLAELALPQELLPVALQLHSLYQPAPLCPLGEFRAHRHPWAMLLGSLLLAVKLCYGLDGRQRGTAGLPPPPAWHEWAQRQLATQGSLSAFPLSINKAAALDEPSFRAYLQYLQRGLLASFSPPSELEDVHQLFHRLALPDPNPEDHSPGANGSGGSGSGSGGGGGGSAIASGAAAAGHAGQPAAVEQVQAAAGQAAAGQAAAGQDRAAAGLVQGSSYLFYGGRRGDRKAAGYSRRLFHPEYAMLLTGCAPLVWLLPEALHDLLAGLEQAMICAECEVSYLHNTEEQARLARVREEAAWLKRHRSEAAQQRRNERAEQERDLRDLRDQPGE